MARAHASLQGDIGEHQPGRLNDGIRDDGRVSIRTVVRVGVRVCVSPAAGRRASRASEAPTAGLRCRAAVCRPRRGLHRPPTREPRGGPPHNRRCGRCRHAPPSHAAEAAPTSERCAIGVSLAPHGCRKRSAPRPVHSINDLTAESVGVVQNSMSTFQLSWHGF